MSLLTWLNPGNLIGKVVETVGSYQMKKKEKEINKISAKSKIELARQAGKADVALKDSEWEAILAEKTDTTWKDEYVTLIITYPLVGVLAGTLLQAFIGNTVLLDGTLEGVKQLKDLGMDYGTLMTIVVSSAVAVKAGKSVFK